MTKIYSYSFSLTPPAPPAPTEPLHKYSYSEFLIDLPAHWKQMPSAVDNTITFQSDTHGAAIIISADFYEIPQAKAQAVAERCLGSRLEALERTTPGRVNVLRRSIKPHSGGVGLELALVAETPEQVHIYLGHVTSRKILNFALVGRPGTQAAAELFDEAITKYRPKFP